MFERKSSPMSIISAFAIGGLIGAAIALLMAPQSGQETISLLRDKGTELKEKAVETADDTRHKVTQSVDDISRQAKDKVSTLRSRGQDAIEDAKDQMQN